YLLHVHIFHQIELNVPTNNIADKFVLYLHNLLGVAIPLHKPCKSFPENHQIIRYTPFQSVGLRSEEHTSELQSRFDLVCRLLLEKKNRQNHFAYLGESRTRQLR